MVELLSREDKSSIKKEVMINIICCGNEIQKEDY